MASSKSYDAFSEVDKLVAKPVLGSDGAAKWQNFQKDSNKISSSSVAPSLPIKKVDRVAGLGNMQEERKQEEKMRKEAGDASLGEGYTVFKRKHDADEQLAKKKRKLIEDRIRPDDVDYFISSKTFQGSKRDYIFTTKSTHGTGYYWDGMDSVKELLGKNGESSRTTTTAPAAAATHNGEPVKKKKKKKKSNSSGTNVAPVFADGSSDPMEQVAKAIQRRNQMMQLPPTQRYQQQQQQQQQQQASSTGLPKGWESTMDPSSGKEYYFNRSTGETSWDLNALKKSNGSNNDTAGGGDSLLPSGWNIAKDEKLNKEYYYHTNGEVRWERPT